MNNENDTNIRNDTVSDRDVDIYVDTGSKGQIQYTTNDCHYIVVRPIRISPATRPWFNATLGT